MREALIHALRNCHDDGIRIRTGSMLVANQLNGIWACRNATLRPIYEECLGLIDRINHGSGSHRRITIQHVYREYNADADSLANQAIDEYDGSLHSDGIVVNQG